MISSVSSASTPSSSDYNVVSSLCTGAQRGLSKERREMRRNYLHSRSKARSAAAAANAACKAEEEVTTAPASPLLSYSSAAVDRKQSSMQTSRNTRDRKSSNLSVFSVDTCTSEEYIQNKVKQAINDRKIRNRLSAIESRTRRIEHAAMLEAENLLLKGNISVLRSRLSLYENPAIIDNFFHANISSNNSSSNISGSGSGSESSSIASTISGNSDYSIHNQYQYNHNQNHNRNHNSNNNQMGLSGGLMSHFNHYTNEPAVFAY